MVDKTCCSWGLGLQDSKVRVWQGQEFHSGQQLSQWSNKPSMHEVWVVSRERQGDVYMTNTARQRKEVTTPTNHCSLLMDKSKSLKTRGPNP